MRIGKLDQATNRSSDDLRSFLADPLDLRVRNNETVGGSVRFRSYPVRSALQWAPQFNLAVRIEWAALKLLAQNFATIVDRPRNPPFFNKLLKPSFIRLTLFGLYGVSNIEERPRSVKIGKSINTVSARRLQQSPKLTTSMGRLCGF